MRRRPRGMARPSGPDPRAPAAAPAASSTEPQHRAYVALGANLGDAAATLRTAMDTLDALPGTRIVARSSIYRTAPVGYADQPAFLNAVVALSTPLGAEPLLDALLAIETAHGRTRSFANAPRTLDLDLLAWDDATIATARLVVPHPRMHERAFVLAPLAEIASDFVIPGRGAVRTLLAAVADQSVERLS